MNHGARPKGHLAQSALIAAVQGHEGRGLVQASRLDHDTNRSR